jgi:hypothetical protein
VITLNAVGASHAVDDFLFMMTGLTEREAKSGYFRNLPMERKVLFENPRKAASCPHCGILPGSALAYGDRAALMTRER